MDLNKDLAETQWDVLIIGGAMAGAATAIELLKRNPDLAVLIVESSEAFGRRVGESTVEVSSYFLSRVLGLSRELNRNHLSKQGLRFWFADEATEGLADCSELGPKYNVLLPGYQVDRARLDQVILEQATELGARLLRPAKVRAYELEAGGMQTAVIRAEDGDHRVRSRWLVDASGVRALIGRGEGWIQTNAAHPVATVWSRWKGVMDWDDPVLERESPAYGRRVHGVRNNSTNHLAGLGWWAWWIPLQNGEVSIGFVYDQRIIELPPGERLGERLKAVLRGHPAGERLLRDAECVERDVSFRRDISYRSSRLAGDGFALVGDASGFLDPFYSPGLDWLCYTVMASAKLIAGACQEGRACPKALAKHNRYFEASYERWFEAIYRDKYYYIGDFELMRYALRLDLGLYYLAVVRRPFRRGPEALTEPSFGEPTAKWPAQCIAFYNRRLTRIAQARIASGRWGRKNRGVFAKFYSYKLDWTLFVRLFWALAQFTGFNLKEAVANRLPRRSSRLDPVSGADTTETSGKRDAA